MDPCARLTVTAVHAQYYILGVWKSIDNYTAAVCRIETVLDLTILI